MTTEHASPQADTLIPQASNPAGWDRFAYCLNNPVRFIDPSGHDPLEEWEEDFYNDNGRRPTDEERQDYLFSLMFLGSGENGTWTEEDWDYYHAHRNDLWSGKTKWIHPEAPGVDSFKVHVERLASHYKPDERSKFVRAFALVFAGIPYDRPWPLAAISVAHGPKELKYLHEDNAGFDPIFIDSENKIDNLSHHYAGIFFVAYFTNFGAAFCVNWARDFTNIGDLYLGTTAAYDGALFRYDGGSSIVDRISNLTDYNAPISWTSYNKSP